MGRDKDALDEALLREVAKRLRSITILERVSVFPPEKPASVVAEIATVYHSDDIRRIELEFRAYQNVDFNVIYREQRTGDDWMMRWDRHENPHNARDHRHRPPDARTGDAVDASFPSDFFDVVERILGDVDDRLGELWEEGPT
ncbi:hypothetical protein EL22_11480 [Halostagnicola sp. A56]|uniref:hypothetical protein n=1 Tax=Halostagnicola sp. A56 TaxID=1495067 RepID=UPI00049EAC59|nr:hypothetical protein [Halostagnicola sp. A56]KDE57535.1 hypothetical protein EL22_11480 [Halostagnicola sp. A56]